MIDRGDKDGVWEDGEVKGVSYLTLSGGIPSSLWIRVSVEPGNCDCTHFGTRLCDNHMCRWSCSCGAWSTLRQPISSFLCAWGWQEWWCCCSRYTSLHLLPGRHREYTDLPRSSSSKADLLSGWHSVFHFLNLNFSNAEWKGLPMLPMFLLVCRVTLVCERLPVRTSENSLTCWPELWAKLR